VVAKRLIDWALIFLALMLFQFRAMAQSVPVDSALTHISKRFHVHFLYSKNFLPARQISNVETAGSLTEALDQLSIETSLEYTISGSTVLLRPKSEDKTKAVTAGKPKTQPAPSHYDWPFGYKDLNFRKKSIPSHSLFDKQTYTALRLHLDSVPIEKQGESNESIPDVRRPVQLTPVYVDEPMPYAFMGQPEASKDSANTLLASAEPSQLVESQALFKYHLFNVSLAPGLGTNGLNPGNSYNGISINLTVDYSAGSNIFGLAGFSNFSKRNTYGFQMAGVLNVVGGDMQQQKHYTRAELEALKSPFLGIQAAGLANLVTGSVTGFQASSLINMAGNGAFGWQLSGVANMTANNLHGLQTAGFFNYTGRFVTGVQLAAVNYARGDLFGAQIGVVNRNKSMNGPNSVDSETHGLQLGAVNFSNRMGGYQIGLFNKAQKSNGLQFALVNVSKESSGHQFGVVNIFRENTGWAFGLVNIGPRISGRIWANETFQTNLGITTGSEEIANTVFYSRNFFIPGNHSIWPKQAWGYGVSKGSLFDPHDLQQLAFKDYRINVSWVNFDGVDKQPFNLMLNPHIVYGRRMDWSMYFVIGAGVNAWWTPNFNSYKLSYLEVATISEANYVWKFWPSLTMSLEFN
tara:strand:- start:92216 stop:94114 length:1899 start_codon:yes stop_codon:yes gene_type:complete